jgi:GNAT superfamily N-acetyltransferase
MKPPLKIEITETPLPHETEFILQQLIKYNRRSAGEGDFKELTIFLRDSDENLVGGLIGSTYYQWLHVDILWVDESCRGEGYGSSLLAAAEQEAVQRGCRYAFLDTFSFQAPEFYQKLGYIIFGELPDFPPGYRRFFLHKAL